MPKLTLWAATAGVAVLSLALTACTSSGASNGGGAASLRSALASVRDTAGSERFFAWADQKELRKLAGVSSAADAAKRKANQKWLRLASVALPSVADKEPQLTDATGIDVYAGDRAITIGLPPDRASRIDGADGGTVLRKFRQLGARDERVGTRTYLALAGEGQVDVSNPLLGGDVYLSLNRTSVDHSTVGFGLTNAPIDAVLGGGGKSLADVADEAAVADCLGEVFVAEVTGPVPGGPDGVSLTGVGVRRPTTAGARVTEVLCEVTHSKDQAGQLAARVTARLAPDAALAGSGLRVRDRIAQANVDQVGKAGDSVRLTLDLVSPARAGFLLLDASPGTLASLGGGAG